ncbi:hypothetical protein AHAS_Ahas10G0140300 [Arachis hypogaea]
MRQLAQYFVDEPTNVFPWPGEENYATSLRSGVVLNVGENEELEEQEKKALVPSEIRMKKEVVEAYEPRISYPQRLLDVTSTKFLSNAPMQDLTKEREKINQENESDDCMVTDFIKPSLQEVLD